LLSPSLSLSLSLTYTHTRTHLHTHTHHSVSFEWPAALESVFSGGTPVVSGFGGDLLSSCLLRSLSHGDQSLEYGYVLQAFFMPLFVIAFVTVLFGLWYRRKLMAIAAVREGKELEVHAAVLRRLAKALAEMTVTVVLFLAHSSITQTMLSLFVCDSVDASDRTYLATDLLQECWTGRHLRYVLGVAVPGILLWVVGIPVFALYRVWQYKDRLLDIESQVSTSS
jgi:hypothetical protein